MTDHIDVPILANGDWIDAAWLNQYLGDNIRAIVQGLANAGSMPYAVDSNTVGELVKPASLGFLKNDASGVLEWILAGANPLKFLRVNAAGNAFEFVGGGLSATYHNNATAYSYSSSTWRDVPNSSKSITVAVPSTIVCIGIVEHHATDSPNFYGFVDFKFNIDGTDIDWALTSKTYGATMLPIPIVGLKTGVTAGSKTVKIRERCNAGSYESSYKHYLILIIPE